jgi:hypothetical protein
MIPSIRRKEWRELVTGSINPTINSHSLKIKISLIKKKVERGMMSPDSAVMDLFVECKTHFNLYKHDLHQIFMVESPEHVNDCVA